MKPLALLLGIVPLVWSTAIQGPRGTAPVVISPTHFEDGIVGETPVGGEIIRGVGWAAAEQPVDTSQLMVHVPADRKAGSKLCIAASTRDGVYQASAVCDLTAASAGVYRLGFPTKHATTAAGRSSRAARQEE